MDNKTLQFKTNLNCGGCVSKVKTGLDEVVGVDRWSVDTNNDDKILTVQSEGINADEVVAVIKSKGFQAESLLS